MSTKYRKPGNGKLGNKIAIVADPVFQNEQQVPQLQSKNPQGKTLSPNSAVPRDSEDVLLLNCKAFSAYQKGDKVSAERYYREILTTDPNDIDANRYLGEILGQWGRPLEALPLLKRAAEAGPHLWSTWCDLGQCLQVLAQTPEEMVEGLGHTILGARLAEQQIEAETGTHQPFAPGHYNTALGLIALGCWKKGYAQYEQGYLCHKRHLRTLKGPSWKGEPINGKRLFVFWEGGYGDTLFWLRILPVLKERTGCKITLEVQRALWGVLNGSDGAHEVCEKITQPNINNMEDLPEYDYRVSIQSLVHWLGLEKEDVPSAPYLYPNVAPWPIRGPQYKVGVVWKGNSLHENDRQRSMTEEEMMGALEGIPGVHFYSLQYGERPNIAIPLPIETYTDTAAMIKAMDLIITVDTSVAHLAGAMGKRVCILLPYVACDYRWGLGTSQTYLYPTARLYRQKKPGDWTDPIERIRNTVERDR